MRLIRIASFYLLILVLLAARGHAQSSDLPTRQVAVDWSRKFPALSFSAQDFADSALRQELKSGLPQNIVIRIYAYAEKEEQKPVALSALTCRVVYDLWEDVFRVQLQTPRGNIEQSLKSAEAAARVCLSPTQVPVGSAEDFDSQQGKLMYFAVLIELNPLSDQTVERIRGWIARSGEGSKMSGDAFFGSFVSIFVNRRMGSAERVFRFRSPLVRVP